MKFNPENAKLWNSLRRAAKELDTDLSGLNGRIGLAEGTLEVMEESGIVPEGELLARLRRFLGLTEREIVTGQEEPLSLEAPRNIFIMKSIDADKPFLDMRNVAGQFFIDIPAGDDREYVGVEVKDESMSRAFIHSGDIAVIRRQAVAEDGDIVAAEIDGETVIRRYHRIKDLVWLEADGYVGDKSDIRSGSLTDRKRRIRIWGKVVVTIHNHDKDYAKLFSLSYE